MAGSLTDITGRKKAEAALAEKAAEIQRANNTLRIAEAESRKAVIERDQFLAMLLARAPQSSVGLINGVGVLDHAHADRGSQ